MIRGASFCGVLLLVVTASAAEKNTGYVDARACRACHVDIYDSYQQTTMGRAFYLPGPDKQIADWKENNTFYHEPSNRYYEMTERDGGLFMRRYQKDAQGREVHALEKQVTHVMGSGKRALTYIHRSPDGRMIEFPVGWYSQEKRWAMSPGYDRPDHAGFTRAITNRCMFCHNGYPLEIPKTDRPGWDHDPRFPDALPMGIDCQRCHGPGEAHIKESEQPESLAKVQSTIVNPARLSNERQLDVCMQCHLETPFRTPKSLRRFGRTFYSYRPGEPLGEYAAYFDYAEGSGHEDDFDIVSAAYRLRKSACFLESEGALTCTTCHDPHKPLAAADREEHFRQVCLGCHEVESAFQKMDCVKCHMPERRTKDVVHVVMTDHWIQRANPDRDLLAPIEEEPHGGQDFEAAASLYFPEDLDGELRNVYLGIAEVKESANREAGVKKLAEALKRTDVQFAEPWFELAEAFVKLERNADARRAYEKALEIDPEYVQAHNNFGNLLAEMGRPQEAVSHLKRAIELDDLAADSFNNLGLAHVDLQQFDDAEKAFRTAIEMNPMFADAHLNLGAFLFQQGKYDAAVEEFRQTLTLDPGILRARNNLAFALLSVGRAAEAIPYLEEVVRQGDESMQGPAKKALELIRSAGR